MAFNRYFIRISIRLVFIFMAMLALSLIIGREARLFSVLCVSLLLVLMILELFWTITRTNRLVGSLMESIRYGDYTRKMREKAIGLGFGQLAESAQGIIRAIASAHIEKETQYQYLQTILEHVHTAVLTLDREHQPEMINPVALNTLGLYTSRKPTWQEIEKAAPPFADAVTALGTSGRKMIRLSDTSTGKKLLVLVTTAKIGGEPVKIVTFQDIEPEIDQKEMESWQTISRIMAHEIMNSLTPLSSLTETGIMLLEQDNRVKDLSDLTQATIDNLYTALKTISGRNRALAQFIGNYRQLSRLPEPERKVIRVADLVGEIPGLYEKQFRNKGIRLSIGPVPDKFTIQADETQVKQVLINLIKNAMEVLEGQAEPVLTLSVKRIFDQVAIDIRDNGPGIPPDVLEKIFVPFYSTKPEGSGIGLSLCRQIMRNHGGKITVESGRKTGTTFRVSFPVE